eukprot:3325107-Alexandrium_andersonii.AAC.1
MASGVQNLNCAVPEKTPELASLTAAGCILRLFSTQAPNPTTKGACGRAGGASLGGPGGRSPPEDAVRRA